MYPNHAAPPAAGPSRNLTDIDLSSHLGPVQSSGGLYVQFFYAKVRIHSTDPTRNGKWVTRLCVAKIPRGDRLTIACRYISEAEAMRQFPHEFAMFKQYESVPTAGTPLQDLPGISQSQIAYLTINNIRSIEDLCALHQEQVNGMGMDVVQAHAVAQRWMSQKTASEPMIEAARTDAKLSAENSRLRSDKTALERRLIELEAKLDVLTKVSPNMMPNAGTTMHAPAMQAIAQEGPDLPDATEVETALFTGGLVDGNDDLDSPAVPEPTPEDPLSLRKSKRA